MKLPSFYVGVVKMRSKANKVAQDFLTHTTQAGLLCKTSSGERRGMDLCQRQLTQAPSFQLLSIGGTTLNFLVAQAPQCERCKSTGLHPSCLLHGDKTCIFRTLLFLWKGHRLVWNIKQLVSLEIKGTLEESGKLQKGFDGIYRSISSRYDGMKE